MKECERERDGGRGREGRGVVERERWRERRGRERYREREGGEGEEGRERWRERRGERKRWRESERRREAGRRGEGKEIEGEGERTGEGKRKSESYINRAHIYLKHSAQQRGLSWRLLVININN